MGGRDAQAAGTGTAHPGQYCGSDGDRQQGRPGYIGHGGNDRVKAYGGFYNRAESDYAGGIAHRGDGVLYCVTCILHDRAMLGPVLAHQQIGQNRSQEYAVLHLDQAAVSHRDINGNQRQDKGQQCPPRLGHLHIVLKFVDTLATKCSPFFWAEPIMELSHTVPMTSTRPVAIKPITAPSISVVPRAFINTTWPTCGLPGPILEKVQQPKMMVPGIKRRGMSAAR